MKPGDKVTIRDYSWVMSVQHGSLTHKRPNTLDDHGKKYTVVETNCSFPLEDKYIPQPRCNRNDTVIQAGDGRVVFIHSRFLKLVPPLLHVWKHGDVFRNHVGGPQIYVELNDGPRCIGLFGENGTPAMQLRPAAEPKFLFNIKDTLADREIV